MQKSYDDEIVPFTAGDGRALNLVHVRGQNRPTRGAVLLVHGAGVRANLFRAPVATNIVDALLERGHDVWLENWRASIDLPRCEWTLDQAALYDHPVAVKTVCVATGESEIQAIIHCQGSTSFAMSAVLGLVPQVRRIISNAVSLHPVVPSWSQFKLNYAVPLTGMLTRYVSPAWGNLAPGVVPKLITGLVRATHHECTNTVCKLVSFTYGSGSPALWRHEQLDDATHDWLRQEFADVPVSFFRQMARSARAKKLLRYETLAGLPEDYTAQPPKTDAEWVLMAGAMSGCFLPESQERTHAWLEQHQPGRHKLHVVAEYSHLDVFIGKNAARDVYPMILDALA